MKTIPVILMIYAFICIPLMWFGSTILMDYGQLLTMVDTALFTISTIHIILKHKTYLKTQINCYFGCLAFLFLERTDLVFKKRFEDFEEYNMVYFWSYVLIVCIVIAKSILDNRNENTY